MRMLASFMFKESYNYSYFFVTEAEIQCYFQEKYIHCVLVHYFSAALICVCITYMYMHSRVHLCDTYFF